MKAMPLLVSALVLAVCQGAAQGDASPLFNIPRLNGIQIDGDRADWFERGEPRGFAVEVMADKNGVLAPKSDLSPGFQLGWNDEGLLVLITVSDDVLEENPDASALWDRDSVEVFAAPKRGDPNTYQLVISPGVTDGFPELRKLFRDFRKDEPKEPLTAEVARKRTGTGYDLELLLPWRNLGFTPQLGAETAFQIYINDTDGVPGRHQAIWYPQTRAHEDTTGLHRVALAKHPSPPQQVRTTGGYDGKGRTELRLCAVGELADAPIKVRDGRRVVARGALEAAGDWAEATLVFPMPPKGASFGPLDVWAGGRCVTTLELPNADKERAKALMAVELDARRPVFDGNAFPALAPQDPLLLENLVGPYRISKTFYDADYNEVASAEKPGRYGAVVRITGADGTALTRFVTLFRRSGEDGAAERWLFRPEFKTPLPEYLGARGQAIADQLDAIGNYFEMHMHDLFERDWAAAAIAAGLAETDPAAGKTTVANDLWARDRQWWVGLKRKLYGTGAVYPNAFMCPRRVEGAPAPVLHDGSPEEAGMKPGAAEAIDAVLRAWVEKSGEPFAACVARRGVVFFHKAYGTRDGQPMTLTTKSWMASISKLLSGTLMMTLVDQGLVDIDAPICTYLPPFRGIQVETPMTVRHLYTHTNGLNLGFSPPMRWTDHWGDDLHDTEERIANIYPYLEIGKAHGYNGVGYALGGKIMEAATGEALPQLFQRHLFGPLGADNTDAVDASAQTRSVPLDMAKVAQLLLNKGAYGNMRFFSEATFQKMLPVPLKDFTAIDTDLKWGIGPVYMPQDGLGPNVFGHGAASAATFLVDPDNDLVITMTRDTAGPYYGENYTKFIRAIADSLVK